MDFSFSQVWNITRNIADLNLDIVGFLKENMHVFTSVLESVYLVLKGNVNLVITILTATLSMLLGGGTAILNFLLSLVVFVTALFYLLASSDDTYKPLQWISAISLSNLEQAISEAISSVFQASLKMMMFYGLYTWLTHTVFKINIVFIPAALAATFGAVPFIGTYWAALPAVMELWLLHNDWISAVILATIHVLPTYIVDTTIYAEIKGFVFVS